MSINTNISLTEKESQIYKRFKNLSINETILPQGDGNIKISPFDDYVLFTLYDEINGEDVPIDLSNVGKLFLSFIGNNDEIRIPYFTNVEDLNLAGGQVLFRITADDSRKILSLDNNNFYISSVMISPDGSNSDESVIYTGTFSSITEAAKESLTSQIEKERLEFSKELAALETENEELKSQVENLTQTIGELNFTIDTLNKSNSELSNEIDELTKESLSSKIINIQLNAKEAQAQSSKVKKNIQQNKILQKTVSSKPTPKSVIVNAANNLQKFS